MTLFEPHLRVKRSTIPKAGKGLFTKVDIPKDSLIVEYLGKVTKWKDAAHGDGLNPYIFYVNRNKVIDAWKTPKHLARYANDAKGLVKVKGLRNNAEYTTKKGRAYIKATRNIPAGSEILVSYGDDYWEILKENLKEAGKI